jgi:hypothetical protein
MKFSKQKEARLNKLELRLVHAVLKQALERNTDPTVRCALEVLLEERHVGRDTAKQLR